MSKLDLNDGIFRSSIDGIENGKTSQVTGMNNILNQIQGNANYLKKKSDSKVDTIEQLKSMRFLKLGEVVEVLGYYTKSDGANHKRVIVSSDDGSGVQLANGLWANIVHNGTVNVSWFGAKGDGATDDTVSFEKSFNILNANTIECQPSKIYNFERVINSRKRTNGFTFNGQSSVFKNFSVEISLKDNEYDWRKSYSPNIATFKKCIFGSGEYETVDRHPFRPNIVSGMPVQIEECQLVNRYVLLAYVQQYIDFLTVKKLTKVANHDLEVQFNSNSPTPIYEYSAIMTIRKNGSLIKSSEVSSETYTTSGDSWLFEQVNEFYSDTSLDNKRYSLVHIVGNQGVNFINCIQIYVALENFFIANFINCHFEKDNTGCAISDRWVSWGVKFDNCYFYISSQFPLAKKKNQYDMITYINCFFRDNDLNKVSTTKSILNYARVINSKIGQAYDKTLSNDNRDLDIQSNYFSITTSEYNNLKVIKWNSPNYGFNNTVKLTVFYKNIQNKNIYFKKLEETIVCSKDEGLSIELTGSAGAEIDFYLEIDGKIYFGSAKFNSLINSFKIRCHLLFFECENNVRAGYGAVYPECDTYEVVEVIPEYKYAPTLFGLGGNLFLDTNNSSTVAGLVRVNSSSVNQGSIVDSISVAFYNNIQQLDNSIYYQEKMKQEGVYNDYISYMDEKIAYDKKVEKFNNDKEIAYQEKLSKNPSLTYEEFISLYNEKNIMMLPIELEEPKPSKALQEFINKWL